MTKPKQKPCVISIYAPDADKVKAKLKQLKEAKGYTISRIVAKAILSL